jgi:hypothetical protein
MFLTVWRRGIRDLYAPEIAMLNMADGEEVVFGGGDAVEAESRLNAHNGTQRLCAWIGAGVGELGFDDSEGGHALDEGVCELVVGGHFLFGEVEGLGEEAVAGGVERGTFFAFLGDGTAGVFGVFAVGAETGFAGFSFRLRAVSGTGFGFGKGGRMLTCPRNWRGGGWFGGVHG